MEIPLKSTFHAAVARQYCALCQNSDRVARGRTRYEVQFENCERRLKINSLVMCKQCYERHLAEYLDFCCYDWENIWFRFSDKNTQYKYDSRFRCND